MTPAINLIHSLQQINTLVVYCGKQLNQNISTAMIQQPTTRHITSLVVNNLSGDHNILQDNYQNSPQLESLLITGQYKNWLSLDQDAITNFFLYLLSHEKYSMQIKMNQKELGHYLDFFQQYRMMIYDLTTQYNVSLNGENMIETCNGALVFNLKYNNSLKIILDLIERFNAGESKIRINFEYVEEKAIHDLLGKIQRKMVTVGACAFNWNSLDSGSSDDSDCMKIDLPNVKMDTMNIVCNDGNVIARRKYIESLYLYRYALPGSWSKSCPPVNRIFS